MEKDKRRALRRHHTTRVQERRAQKWELRRWNVRDIPAAFGKLRKTHFGCGCWMCKPWKWDFYLEPWSYSELRRLQEKLPRPHEAEVPAAEE